MLPVILIHAWHAELTSVHAPASKAEPYAAPSVGMTATSSASKTEARICLQSALLIPPPEARTCVIAPYYETHAGGLTVPTLDVVLRAELIRGALIVASVLFFLLTLRTAKKRLILLTALILFSVGGLVPLTMQASALPFILLLASAVEIRFQNFSTGAVAALLLGQSE